MSIKIIIAEPHGFCGNENFGVVRAIKVAQGAARTDKKVYLLGEVVHNQHVVTWLEKNHGVKTVHNLEEIPKGATVIIRAHGAVPSVYEEARKRGLQIIDATCPLVTQVHKEVKQLVAEGKQIIYLASDKNHDEAVGVAGEAPEAVTLTTLKKLDGIRIVDSANTVILTQTTLSILETKDTLERLKRKYPSLTIKPHICLATTERQKAIIDLAKKIGLVIIVGSPTSSNSKRLKEVAEAVGARAYLVDSPDELNPDWFKGIKRVAISSGASTPEWLLDKVIKKINSLR